MDQDRDQLRLLSIFHYIVGSLLVLFGCLPMIHLALGIAVVSGALPPDPGKEAFSDFMGWLFIGLATFSIVACWSLAALVVVAGRSLAGQRHHTFCLVVAAIECLFMPFGTVLGVLTIIVLLRPSVKPLFDEGSGPVA